MKKSRFYPEIKGIKPFLASNFHHLLPIDAISFSEDGPKRTPCLVMEERNEVELTPATIRTCNMLAEPPHPTYAMDAEDWQEMRSTGEVGELDHPCA